MPPASPLQTRFLLCASATHCARILHAAAAARMRLHDLQPVLAWPHKVGANNVVLWAVLPHPLSVTEVASEQLWRQRLSLGQHACAVQMLYGNASQQAAQLAPWIPHPATGHQEGSSAVDCWECLDAASEQKLFQHLLQRT